MIGKLLLRRRGNMVRPMVTETGGLVQCRPVPDSLLGIKSYFSPVETPPTEGEKSPTNPSTISGWESVEITRCGKNLYSYDLSTASIYTERSTVLNATESSVTAEATGITPELKSDWGILSPPLKFSTSAEGTYITVSCSRDTENTGFQLVLVQNRYNGIDIDYGTIQINNKTITLRSPDTPTPITLECWFGWENIEGALLTIDNIQVELGTAPTTYIPYQGNTYTATFPSEIGGGYVDWERGVLVKEWETRVLDGSETYFGGFVIGTTKFRFWTANVMNGAPKYSFVDQVCNRLPISGSGIDTTNFASGICVYKKNNFIYGYIEGLSTIDEVVDFISDNNIVIAYKLATPVETPLSDLPAIYAIDGINTIYSNAGDVEVTYKGAR